MKLRKSEIRNPKQFPERQGEKPSRFRNWPFPSWDWFRISSFGFVPLPAGVSEETAPNIQRPMPNDSVAALIGSWELNVEC